MDRFVPINKRSKREQKEFYSSQRNTWNGLNPVTRTVPNGKGYNRNKLKAEERRNSRRSNDYGSPAVFVCRDMCFAGSAGVFLLPEYCRDWFAGFS